MWQGHRLPLVTGRVPTAWQWQGSTCLWRLIGSLSLSLSLCLSSAPAFFPGGLSLWSDAASSSVPAMSMQPRSLTPRSCQPEVGLGRGLWWPWWAVSAYWDRDEGTRNAQAFNMALSAWTWEVCPQTHHNFHSLIWGLPGSLSGFSCQRGTGGLGDVSLKTVLQEKQCC